MNDFVVHACEQVLRFTTVDTWDDLPENRKVQLSFNMGVVALGLGLSKEEGYNPIADACKGEVSMQELHQQVRSLVDSHNIPVNEQNIAKPL